MTTAKEKAKTIHLGYCTIAVKEAMARSQDIYFQGEKQTCKTHINFQPKMFFSLYRNAQSFSNCTKNILTSLNFYPVVSAHEKQAMC